MSPLLESLAAGFDGDAARRPALDAALAAGLPGPRSESWKYTSLRALERRVFAAPGDAAIDPALLAGIPAPRLVFVNGRPAPALSDPGTGIAGLSIGFTEAAALPAIEDRPDAVFARLNAALATDGVVITVNAATEVATPLHLVFVGAPADTDQAWHLRHHIALGADARLTVVEHHLDAGTHRHLDNSVCSLRLADRAHLRHLRLQRRDAGATAFLRTDAELQAGAIYDRVDVEAGAALSRHELDVRLVGADARLTANGVLLAGGRGHLDTRLGIRHIARDTACQLLWRGIGDGRGRVVFHGGITIDAGADGTDARLSNKNLLLSATAEIDTQPVLVIHADEVQAAHGATVGQLDPGALFYLRSRGLPAGDAQRLLTAAFVREPLAAIADETLRTLAETALDDALAALVRA
ncbi:Fe-S cluster assembly protein SufD [Luteimonas sp. RC10]|uniref:Fe-S cluster assembly protein SufD n=1 Tax=Luteimonas sp. RC10 TaxID=2587035 RepID=UPI0016109893|nr:Fe-S cluster assembly protein SufD [Luteimonas sp. RC10]MBB3344303.1 Fe-S cluster assembly protein SufD [Luteimonas sp. RC10]